MNDDDLLVRLIRELDALYVAAMVSNDPVAWARYVGIDADVSKNLGFPPLFGIMGATEYGAGAALDKPPGVALSDWSTEMLYEYTCQYCGGSFAYHRPPTKWRPLRFCSNACCVEGVRRERSNRDPLEKLQSRYVVDEATGCWEWTHRRSQAGYGYVVHMGNDMPAHRAVYQMMVGPIPEGLELDHLCRNRGCVNPAHLEPVTHAENLRRGMAPSALVIATGKCKRGHDFVGDNIYTDRRGMRQCKACMRIRGSQRNRKQVVA